MDHFPLSNAGHPTDDDYLWVLNSVEPIDPEACSLFPLYADDEWLGVRTFAQKESADTLLVMVPDIWQLDYHLMRAVSQSPVVLVPLKPWQVAALPGIVKLLGIKGIITSLPIARELEPLIANTSVAYLHVLTGPHEKPYTSAHVRTYTEVHAVPALPLLSSCVESPGLRYHVNSSYVWKTRGTTLSVTDTKRKRFNDLSLPQQYAFDPKPCTCGASGIVTLA